VLIAFIKSSASGPFLGGVGFVGQGTPYLSVISHGSFVSSGSTVTSSGGCGKSTGSYTSQPKALASIKLSTQNLFSEHKSLA
jgi:hypothetical protein